MLNIIICTYLEFTQLHIEIRGCYAAARCKSYALCLPEWINFSSDEMSTPCAKRKAVLEVADSAGTHEGSV